jgi:hypothetical protein
MDNPFPPHADLKHGLKEPCKECPFVGRIPGWIGEHETAEDFVDHARYDLAYPCHMNKTHQCCGQVMFMNRMCKLSRDPVMLKYQQELKANPPSTQIVWPPSKLIEIHAIIRNRKSTRERGGD